MMRFSTLVKHPADWMTGKGRGNAVVITSRIRLARNLKGMSFPGWAKKKERVSVMEMILPVLKDLPAMSDGFAKELANLSLLNKQVMVERHLISREQAARGTGCAAVVNRKQSLSIMVNEEDHLRMQAIASGLKLRLAYQRLNELDQQVEKKLPYAYSETLGYITACPSNLGTGMRASVMLHLPALVITEQVGQVLQAVSKIGLAVRGIFGEGTESLGHLFQISNQSTLGESEEAIIERLERVINQVASHEQNARLKMIEDDREVLFDKISRAYGVLKYARLFDSKEAFGCISLVRLGADLGYFEEDTMEWCDSLMMEVQPAHLQVFAGEELEPECRDRIRAEIIHHRLQSLKAPVSSSLLSKTTDGDDIENELPIE